MPTVRSSTSQPAELRVSGNVSGNVVFRLTVIPGDNNDPADGDSPSVFGDICLATTSTATAPQPATTNPATKPVSQTQPATAPSVGYLVAFDGTWDFPNNPNRGGDFGGSTAIRQFYEAYTPNTKTYFRGVGNAADHGLVGQLLHGAFGLEASQFVESAEGVLEQFYAAAANRSVPVDIVGYSRAAFEAVALANWIATKGIPDLTGGKTVTVWNTKNTLSTTRTLYTKPPIHPKLRFLGLISPVGEIGLPLTSLNLGTWPTSAPASVANMIQILDNQPNDPIFIQTTIESDGVGDYYGPILPYSHPAIGVESETLEDFTSRANQDGVPVSVYAP